MDVGLKNSVLNGTKVYAGDTSLHGQGRAGYFSLITFWLRIVALMKIFRLERGRGISLATCSRQELVSQTKYT